MKAMTGEQEVRRRRRSALITGILLGIGIIGFLDETIFHQLLQWHSFYWATDQHGRILSDGLFHAFSTLILLLGTWRLWRGRSDWNKATGRVVVAGILIGAGGFNFYDGVVQHVILRLHLVNELVCLAQESRQDTLLGICTNDVPFEIAWIVVGFLVLLAGLIMLRRSRGDVRV